MVRCVWYGRHYKDNLLFTEDGTRLEVLSPGWWNVEDGPDFRHAEVLLGENGLLKGDVEVHVFSSDWGRHGHDKQMAYNNVCLHVSMWNDRKEDYVFDANGRLIPQLALHKYIEAGLDELFETINIEEYPSNIEANAGLCQKRVEFNRLNKEWIGRFLDYAGDERIILKAMRFKELLKKGTFEQVLYESIMGALGYKNNKPQFLRLASILPFKEIQKIIPMDLSINEKVLYIHALLFGLAGLLPNQFKMGSSLKKDRQDIHQDDTYIQKVERVWERDIAGQLSVSPMDGRIWQFSKTRPPNFPTRRLAAMGYIIARGVEQGLFKLFMDVFEEADSHLNENKQIDIITKGLESIFSGIFDDYWSYYYVFGGKRLSSPEQLIGKERVAAILINVVIPILFINARKENNLHLEKRLHIVYKMYPRLQDNNITRFMANRIFGLKSDPNKIVYNARRQQGLHQIFTDFCDSDNFLCDRCALFLMLEDLETVTSS